MARRSLYTVLPGLNWSRNQSRCCAEERGPSPLPGQGCDPRLRAAWRRLPREQLREARHRGRVEHDDRFERAAQDLLGAGSPAPWPAGSYRPIRRSRRRHRRDRGEASRPTDLRGLPRSACGARRRRLDRPGGGDASRRRFARGSARRRGGRRDVREPDRVQAEDRARWCARRCHSPLRSMRRPAFDPRRVEGHGLAAVPASISKTVVPLPSSAGRAPTSCRNWRSG